MRSELFTSPYSLDADIDDMRDLLARFAGKRIFFDGVFKGDYSLPSSTVSWHKH